MCTSTPKVPKPTPVIERQAYRSPAPRESLGSPDAIGARRRKMAGIETSALGVTDPASTTRNVLGGAPLSPSIGGGGGSPVTPGSVATQPAPIPTPVSQPNTNTSGAPKKKGISASAAALFGFGPVGAAAYRKLAV